MCRQDIGTLTAFNNLTDNAIQRIQSLDNSSAARDYRRRLGACSLALRVELAGVAAADYALVDRPVERFDCPVADVSRVRICQSCSV